MEGNRVSYEGLMLLSDLTPSPLTKVVWVNIHNVDVSIRIIFSKVSVYSISNRAIWNNLSNTVPESATISTQKTITVDFSDDDMWDGWGEWVLRRCEVSSNEKLLRVLHKVCNVSFPCSETRWAKFFYRNLLVLVKNRIELCTEDDICKKLKKFQNMLTFWYTQISCKMWWICKSMLYFVLRTFLVHFL